MSRKSQAPAVIDVEPGPLPAAHAITLMETQVVSAIENNHSEERDLVNQLLGQIQMASALQKLTTVVSLTKLAHIKETKLYRALAGKTGVDANGAEIADVGTWDGFCRALGYSKSKVDEDLINLKAFGEDALESLTRIGAGVREMRQYRRLPADERTALIEAAKAGDKDELLDLAETLIARHTKEKEGLEARAKEAEETAEARDQVVKAKESKITQLEEANHKLKRRIETATPDEIGEQLREEVSQFAFGAEAQILGNLRQGFAALDEHAQAHGVTHENFMAGCLAQIEAALLTIRNEFYVKDKPDADPVPAWIKDTRPAEEILQESLGAEIARFNARHAAANK
ncbi:MAG: hypothetical protein ROZ09_11590 [Thiobacillus sp.]|uniref:hypothetical protein n=1 Tax=Thiobacillus sp. TaxID=924 RepID=UPI002893AAFA|nr:hypothetical protein [Thiobacillus sp.]MDT3707462.1 hypothetical protein [Thiobacillus sp.]